MCARVRVRRVCAREGGERGCKTGRSGEVVRRLRLPLALANQRFDWVRAQLLVFGSRVSLAHRLLLLALADHDSGSIIGVSIMCLFSPPPAAARSCQLGGQRYQLLVFRSRAWIAHRRLLLLVLADHDSGSIIGVVNRNVSR